MSILLFSIIGCGPDPVIGDWVGEWEVEGFVYDLELEVEDPDEGYINARGELSIDDVRVELNGTFTDQRKRDDYEISDEFECDQDVCAYLTVDGGGTLWINADFSDDLEEIDGDGIFVLYRSEPEEDFVAEGDIHLERD